MLTPIYTTCSDLFTPPCTRGQCIVTAALPAPGAALGQGTHGSIGISVLSVRPLLGKCHPRLAQWGQGGRGGAAHPPFHSVCSLAMLNPVLGHPMVLPAAFCLEEREELPAQLPARSSNNSPFRRAGDCTCRDMSAPLITRTWEQHTASGPSRIFPLPAWEAVGPETVLERSCHQWYHRMGWQRG